MKTANIARAATTSSALYATLLPTAPPTVTKDPWQCATSNISQYFDPPKPTGTLLSAIVSYADEIFESCSSAAGCDFPPQSKWCRVTSAIKGTMIKSYVTYASSASSWVATKSGAMVAAATECPNTWWNSMIQTPNGDIWLNDTLIFSECYASLYPPSSTRAAPQKTV